MSNYDNDEKVRRKFDELSKKIEPKPKIIKNCFNAFWVGGSICTIAQCIRNILLYYGVPEERVVTWLPIIVIFIAALLTGLGVYDKIAVIAGAGTIVPITGFSNAIVSPAMEYKREGFILGIGSKMFAIAGAVLVYGIGSSVIIGIIYYFLLRFGVVV